MEFSDEFVDLLYVAVSTYEITLTTTLAIIDKESAKEITAARVDPNPDVSKDFLKMMNQVNMEMSRGDCTIKSSKIEKI
ncbi:MAG: hypothetical protein EZS28_013779 [Streblomastix strix]|uniref:Uncharacterized protein n=1 Tax=Streblomastix strix TaxID=222440 RepID=A0A5J4W7Z5_9EUKA|nr:MAG: hypothetical protein EZS28_013779 [Streblomastix strix]